MVFWDLYAIHTYKIANTACTVAEQFSPRLFIIHPSKTWLIMSWLRPSVCPSINFSCTLHNSDTVKDIFMKLDTNIDHHQMTCREQKFETPSTVFEEWCPFGIFWWKSCPLYNCNTIRNIFMKLGTNIKHEHTMWGKRTVTPPGSFLWNYVSLKVGAWSFEGIIILLIYFLNFRKPLFRQK